MQGHAQARDVLRQAQRHRQHRMQQAEHRARQGGRQHAHVQRRAQVDDEPAREGPGGHDAFNAQVHDAGAFAQQHAQSA
ncbi:hypothetical protein G6F21_014598 [Rhizopus arrhizus]|nr:hypothetical protein G6F21_014598 [Rhizopus arrhizus]